MFAPTSSPASERVRDGIAQLTWWLVVVWFLGYYGLGCFRHNWGGDFQMYVAAISRLYSNFWDPGHEALALPTAASSMYTPYLVLVAGLGELTGVTPYRALQCAGLFNLFFYVFSVRYFFSRHSVHYRYQLPAACFMLVSLCLRSEHFGWSSETSLLSFASIQAYPATLAWGLAFVALGLVKTLAFERRLKTLVLLTLTFAGLVSCHALTASWVFGTVGIYAVYVRAVHRRRGLIPWLSAAWIASLLLAEFWPYDSLLGHFTHAGVSEPSKFGARPLHDFGALYWVTLPAALWLWLRQRVHTVWLFCFLGTGFALFVWRALGVSFGNRYSFFMAFFAQFVLAEALALAILVAVGARVSLKTMWRARRFDRLLLASLLPVAVLALASSPMLRYALDPTSPAHLQSPGALLQQPSPHDSYYRRYVALRQHLQADDLIMMPTSRVAFDLAALSGARVVSAPGAIRAHDVVDRFRAAALFFQPGVTDRVRSTLIVRYRATRILVPASHAALLPELVRQWGPPSFSDASFVLFDTV